MIALATVEGVAILLLGLLVAGLLRSHAEILRALHELGAGVGDPASRDARPDPLPATPPAGRPASDLSGATPDGDPIAVGIVGTAHRTLLAFLSSGCLTCHGFWDAFSTEGERSLPRDTRLVIVTKGAESESPSRLRGLAPRQVPVVLSSMAWDDYGVPVAPYFVYVDGPSGAVLGEGAAGRWDQVVELFTQALDDEEGPFARRAGGRGSRGSRRWAEREARADEQLLASGLRPGDPSLYPSASAEEP